MLNRTLKLFSRASLGRALGTDARTGMAWVQKLKIEPVAEVDGSPLYAEEAVSIIRQARNGENPKEIKLPLNKSEALALAYLQDFDRILKASVTEAQAILYNIEPVIARLAKVKALTERQPEEAGDEFQHEEAGQE